MIGGLPPGTPAAFEAAYGWGWLVELLEDYGFGPHLVRPPPAVRQLRALLRHRAQLVRLRTLLRNRIHAVLAGHGHDRPAGCRSGPGRAWLASLPLPSVSREVTEDDLALIGALQVPIDRLDQEVRQRARSGPRVKVLTRLPGVGPFTGMVILAEVGDITRFSRRLLTRAWHLLTDAERAASHQATTPAPAA